MTICMMNMVHHTIFRHMKKMKTAIGSCSMGKQLSKKFSKVNFAVEFSLNHAHIWPNLKLEGGKPIPSP